MKKTNKQTKTKNAILVGSLKLLVSLPQTKLLIYTTSSKPSKKVPLRKRTKKKRKKHSLQQPGRGEEGGGEGREVKQQNG